MSARAAGRVFLAVALLCAAACTHPSSPGTETPDGNTPGGIGPGGGQVSSSDGASATIPPGALTAVVPIAIAPVSAADNVALPGGLVADGTVFAFTPHGTTFSQPVTVALPAPPDALDGGVGADIYTSSDGVSWSPLGASLAGGQLLAQVEHFSYFTVAHQRFQWSPLVSGFLENADGSPASIHSIAASASTTDFVFQVPGNPTGHEFLFGTDTGVVWCPIGTDLAECAPFDTGLPANQTVPALLSFIPAGSAPSGAPAWVAGTVEGAYRWNPAPASGPATWEQHNSGLPNLSPTYPEATALGVDGQGVVYVGIEDPNGAQSGLFLSGTNGDLWYATSGIPAGCIPSAIDDDGQRLLAATLNCGLYESTDSWNWSADPLPNTATYWRLLAFGSVGSYVFVGGEDGLFRSVSGSDQWTKLSAQLYPGALPVGGVFALATVRGILLAAVEGAGLYASFDGGDTWESISTGLPLGGSFQVKALASYGDLVIAGTTAGVFRAVLPPLRFLRQPRP